MPRLVREYVPRSSWAWAYGWSLALFASGFALFATSCLISPPSPLEQAEQIPPRILSHLTTPSPLAYVETSSSGQVQTFRVEFVSEDLGARIVGKLYTDLDTANQEVNNSGQVEGGSLDDPQPRVMELAWQRSATKPAGCYVITMTITYENNYDNIGMPEPEDTNKTAYVSWWVAHDIAPQDLNFDQCPQPGPDPNNQELGD
jgi:hypothetical protein